MKITQNPIITIYSRTLDIVTEEPTSDWKDINDTSDYGGVCSIGGLSNNIVQFDIWNNEPALSGGYTRNVLKDATLCEFICYNNSENINPLFEDNIPFLMARCRVNDIPISDFQFLNKGRFSNIRSGRNTKKRMLNGHGDHFIIDTIINCTSNKNIYGDKLNFGIGLYYCYENGDVITGDYMYI